MLRWEDNIQFWQVLHRVIGAEPLVPQFLSMHGLLSELGIEKGKPFNPDARMKAILEKAAKAGRDQMLVSAFDSARPDRINWPDRKWEWIGLVPGSAQFETPNGLDLEARDRWFAQAIVTSPAMFNRAAGAGSLYWLSARDASGAFLDGGKTYKLTIPQPVPGKLFWSVTVVRRANPLAGANRPRQSGPALTVRAEGRRIIAVGRPLLRPSPARRSGGALDQDRAGQGLVRLLPHLRTGAGRVRQELEAGRLRGDRATIDRAGIAVNGSSSSIGG